MAHKNVEFFRENLRQRLDGYGKSKPIAEAAGIDRSFLSQLIHGRKEPSLDVACRIAEALQIPLDDLVKQPRTARPRKAS